MKTLFAYIILFSLACFSYASDADSLTFFNPAPTSPKHEVRAVWLTTLYGLDWPKTKATNAASRERQKSELCVILDQLKQCGINTVILQTRVRGSVIYPSKIEPWDVCLTGKFDRDPGYDPLAFAIEECHHRGMQLHAWMVMVPAFKVAVAKQMGKRGLLSTNPKLLRKVADTYFLNPADKASSDYLTNICREVVSRYDVDGIHFDYIRYPGDVGEMPDAQDFKKSKAKNKADWRRDNITRIVRQAHAAIKAIKPWVCVSCAPIGKFNDVKRYSARGWSAFGKGYQDAQGWLRDGIMDMLCPMMYFAGDHFYPFAADWQEQSHGRIVAPGLGIYFLDPSEGNWDFGVVQRELSYIRSMELPGQAYFRSKFLTDNNKGIYDYLQRTYYPHPALLPPMTWIDDTPPAAPHITTNERTNGTTQRIAWQPQETEQGGCRYAIYASQSTPVDTDDARNLVCVTDQCQYTYNLLAATLYDYHLAITAIDRCGNESLPTPVE